MLFKQYNANHLSFKFLSSGVDERYIAGSFQEKNTRPRKLPDLQVVNFPVIIATQLLDIGYLAIGQVEFIFFKE